MQYHTTVVQSFETVSRNELSLENTAAQIIDARTLRFEGHVPAGWFPTRAFVDRGSLYVVNAKGQGTGPNHDPSVVQDSFPGAFRRGSISIVALPQRDG